MYFKNKLSGNMVPVVHANGPAKFEKSWDDAVTTYFSEPSCEGEMSKDITVITWSIPEEETLLEIVKLGQKNASNESIETIFDRVITTVES